MKKVIKGRVYCTDTAKELGCWCNTANRSDFAWASETLYKTKSGQYFLHCEGGPLSRYGSHFGNESGYGEKIEVMTIDQAKTWAEERLDGDEYEAIFGIPEEDDLKVTIMISGEAKTILEEQQSRTSRSFAQIIEEAIMNTYSK